MILFNPVITQELAEDVPFNPPNLLSYRASSCLSVVSVFLFHINVLPDGKATQSISDFKACSRVHTGNILGVQVGRKDQRDPEGLFRDDFSQCNNTRHA